MYQNQPLAGLDMIVNLMVKYSLIDQRLFVKAHEKVDGMLSGNYNEPSLHVLKAFIYVEQENSFSAIDSFEKAMQQGLNDPDSFFVYGITLIDVKRYSEAIDILQKAIDIRGEVPNLLANLAIAYELDKQKDPR